MGQVQQMDLDGNIVPLNEHVVTVDNVLTSSAHDLTVNAKRLLMLAYGKQDPRAELLRGHQLQARITAREWFTLYSGGRRKPYDEMREAAKELQKSTVTVYPCTEYYEDWNFTTKARYTHATDLDSAYVEITFTNEVSTLLNDIFDNYTTYDLRAIAELSSSYAVRMYEQLARFRDSKTGCGWFRVELAKLQVMFGAAEKYPRMNDFVKRCVVSALDQIDHRTDTSVTYQLEKKGRSYHMLHVNFKPKQQLDLLPTGEKGKGKGKGKKRSFDELINSDF
jgi:plasmid replication initiation protein